MSAASAAGLVLSSEPQEPRPPTPPSSSPPAESLALAELEARFEAPLPATRAAPIFYPDCITPRPDDAGRYPYQRVGQQLLAAPFAKNLLVPSPTGSGKTRLIEYCVALARERGERLYIAEPLIALVEQIYTRVRGPGDDVAMRTGPSRKGEDAAPIVVCTYEVLARIVASDDEALDGCPRIVIDEYHFVGSDRGSVLMEILTCCRAGREVVALSGTLPNVHQLAAHLSRLNGFPTYVIGAPTRPIEIQFYHYASQEDRMRTLRPSCKPVVFEAGRVGGLKDRQALLRFVDQLTAFDSHPTLIVAFSCKRLDTMAEWAATRDFSTRASRSLVTVAFARLLERLPPVDAPLFASYRSWALRGIAVHHSHAPVQYLELVSWLAERRALTLVFSSSTLSAGINLPVRTVALAAARVPQKAPSGGVVHHDISPLLFHQLVGRAGRPGFETVGYCVLLTHDYRHGYETAQALMQCSLPPVVPPSSLVPGDVLRALRQHRRIIYEALCFGDAAAHAEVLRAERDAGIEEAALRMLAPARGAELRAAAALVHVVVRKTHLLCHARPAGAPCRLLVTSNGYRVLPGAAPPGEGSYELTAARPMKRWPFEYAAELAHLRLQLLSLTALVSLSPFEQRVASLLYGTRRSAMLFQEAPDAEAYQAMLKELDACVVDEALTPLGLAACELRTCQEPHRVLAALLAVGVVEWRAALTFASQVLGEGSDGDEAVVTLPVLVPELTAALASLSARSARSWTTAVLQWAEGSELVDVATIIPVGCFARHVTRVADCCQELAHALRALGADASAAVYEEAQARIWRGLPFAKRGAWKASLPEVDDATCALEGAALPASPRVHRALDFSAVFNDSEVEDMQVS